MSKDRKHQDFQPACSSSGSQWLEPVPAAQGARWEPTLDRPPFIAGPLTLTHTHSEQDNGDTLIRLMSMSLGGGGEETGGPGENPHRHGKNVQTPHRHWPQPEIFFSSSHQRYNEPTLNKTMLFEDLLYCFLGTSRLGARPDLFSRWATSDLSEPQHPHKENADNDSVSPGSHEG